MSYLKKIVKHPKFLRGGRSEKNWVVDALEYMIPIYGTYKSWKDVQHDPSVNNIGLATLSTIGDIATPLYGSGEYLNAITGVSKASKSLAASTKAMKAAEATTEAAKAAARASAKAANRATQRVASLSLQNGIPTNIIIDAQRTANAARMNAKAHQNAYRAASIAETGWDPLSFTKTIGGGAPGATRASFVLDVPVSGGRYVRTGQSAVKSLQNASRASEAANEALKSAKSNALLINGVGNPAFHAAGIEFRELAK